MIGKISFLLHVSDGCEQCLAAMSLLEHYGLKYETSTAKCEEWGAWPAVYIKRNDRLELLGGYDQLINFVYDVIS